MALAITVSPRGTQHVTGFIETDQEEALVRNQTTYNPRLQDRVLMAKRIRQEDTLIVVLESLKGAYVDWSSPSSS